MQNGIIGDTYGTELPETLVEDASLIEEKNRAKFSRTAEYKRQKAWVEQRIDFYQKMLPDGRVLTAADNEERGHQWVIANAIIGEYKMFLSQYEDAKEVVENATKAPQL